MALIQSSVETDSKSVCNAPVGVDPNVALPNQVGESTAIVSLPCVHCKQPTKCLTTDDPGAIFCCSGCRSAYELIHGWGLDAFYAIRDQMNPANSPTPVSTNTRFEQFDTSEFFGAAAPVQSADGTCHVDLAVHGLHCGACAWLIENVAATTPGWLSARVKLSDHTLRIVYDAEQTKLSRIAALLDKMGYQLAPLDKTSDKHIELESRRLLIRIAVAGFLAANSMWIAVALYAGEFSGVAIEHRYFLGLVGTILGVLSVAGPGRTFFVGAIASLKTKTPHMDVPIALGLAVGTVMGLLNAIRGKGDIYFDSLATLVFLLMIGRWIQFRQQQRAARAVDLMLRITPRHATRIAADARMETVRAESLMVGDRIRVVAGESLAADGVILEGSTTIDRSLLTGESLPVPRNAGDDVSAGTVNISAPITVRVTAVGSASRVGRIMQSVESAASDKAPIVLLANRIGGVFVIVVTLLAVGTFLAWLPAGLDLAAGNATALLIVSCPCALAMATPLAIAIGLGKAAKCQILIRDGQSLQRLSQPGRIWLDKTGTLTEGRHQVTSLYGSVQALGQAAAIERDCLHPVANAIVREAEVRKLEIADSGKLEQALAGGVVGCVAGRRVCVGNFDFVRRQGILISDEWIERSAQLLANGESPQLVAVDGQVMTLIGLSDPLRVDAKAAIQKLQQAGWSLGILSGDHHEVVSKVATKLSISEFHGGVTPEEKLAAIRESRSQYPTVVMVGDGANDAAALAAADVGVAVRGGAEVSLQAAPIYIASGKLASLLSLVRGSSRTTRIIYSTFAVSLGYNILAVGLAMTGWISPLVAAVLMPISSVSVLTLTLASKSFQEESI